MEFKINQKQKKDLVKLNINSDKYLCKINKSTNVILGFCVIVVLLFLIFGERDNAHAITEIFISSACMALFAFWLKKLVKNFAGSNITDRLDETMKLENDTIIYSFREKFKNGKHDKICVTIPLLDVQEVKINKLQKITLKGNFSKEFLKNKDGKEDVIDNIKICNIIIYDYFSPELKQYIIKEFS